MKRDDKWALSSLEAEAQAQADRLSDHPKIDNHSELEEEGEPWLLSYADMVTLLMCFFVIFFSLDKSKGGISDPQRVKDRLQQMIGVDSRALSSPEADTTPRAAAAKTFQSALERELKPLSKELKIVFSLNTPRPGVVEVTFLSSNFFDSGSATMTSDGSDMVQHLVPRLKALDENTQMEVEGHTDSDRTSGRVFASNWELSAARAASVVRLLEAEGIAPGRLKVAGFGPNRPIANESSGDVAAKKLNRRILIRVQFAEP